jgi:putative pre-16S rRNA nuclease
MTATDSPQTILGLDYGLRRTGMALGDLDRCLAFACGTHVEGRDGSIFQWIRNLISERGVTSLVVGLPLKSDGTDGDITGKVRVFARKLEEEFDLPVVLWDERFSSQEADRWLQAKRKVSKEDRDALAAEIILQSYLDSLGREGQSP